MKNIRDQDYVIALALDGKMLDSVELSEKIGQLGIEGKSSVAFVIGGSLGLSEQVLKRADFRLSFSRMTFPHQLMQMILLEQIYRGFHIPVSYTHLYGGVLACKNAKLAAVEDAAFVAPLRSTDHLMNMIDERLPHTN